MLLPLGEKIMMRGREKQKAPLTLSLSPKGRGKKEKKGEAERVGKIIASPTGGEDYDKGEYKDR